MRTTELLVAKYGPLLTIEDLTAELRRSKKGLYNAISDGTLEVRTFKMGRRRYAHAADVGAYIDRRRRSP